MKKKVYKNQIIKIRFWLILLNFLKKKTIIIEFSINNNDIKLDKKSEKLEDKKLFKF